MSDVAAPPVTWRGNCWSPEEDQIILSVVSREGPKWGRVLLALPWRTVPSIRNRWQRMENGRKLRESGVESKNRCHACGQPRRGHVCLAKLSGSTSGLGPGLPSAYHSYTPPASRLPAAGTQPHAMSPPGFGQSLSIGVATLGSSAEAGATHGAPASSDVHALPGGPDVLGHGSSRKGASLTWPTGSSASTHTEDGGCSSATGPSAAAVLPVHFPCPSPPLRPSGPGGPGRPGSERGESSAGPSDLTPLHALAEISASRSMIERGTRRQARGTAEDPSLALGGEHQALGKVLGKRVARPGGEGRATGRRAGELTAGEQGLLLCGEEGEEEEEAEEGEEEGEEGPPPPPPPPSQSTVAGLRPKLQASSSP